MIYKRKYGLSIIATYCNNGQFFGELLSSFAELNLDVNHELIVVDDGSDDSTYLKAAQMYNNVSIVKIDTNRGVQRARNKGLSAAKYKYTLMIDGDDKFSSESKQFISQAIHHLDNNNSIAFVHGLTYMFDGYSGYTISSYPLTLELVAKMHHVPTSIMYRTDEAVAAGGYNVDINKWQDWAFGVALLNYKKHNDEDTSIAFVPLKSILYRTVNNNSRISQMEIEIKQVVQTVINLYKEFFEDYYSTSNPVLEVMNNKPTRLMELINVARYDYDLAVKIIEERGYDVNHSRDKEWIP